MDLNTEDLNTELVTLTEKYMKLNIWVEDETLKQKYEKAAQTHNNNVMNNEYPDAGFDLFTPVEYLCASEVVTKINFQVKCAAQHVFQNNKKHTGYYMYPRSSMSKTKLRLANSVGIIDSGYRGDIIGAFDCISKNEEYKVLKYDKLVQLCSPNLVPILVRIVDSFEELGENTHRGDGGFGSTGR